MGCVTFSVSESGLVNAVKERTVDNSLANGFEEGVAVCRDFLDVCAVNVLLRLVAVMKVAFVSTADFVV